MSKNTLLNYFTKTVNVNDKGKGSQDVSANNDSVAKKPTADNVEKNLESPDNLNLKNSTSCKKRRRQEMLEKFSPVLEKKQKMEDCPNTEKEGAKRNNNNSSDKRRKRIIIEPDSAEDSGNEYRPDEENSSQERDSVESSFDEESENSTPEKPSINKKKSKKIKSCNSSLVSDKPKIPLSASISSSANDMGDDVGWPHLKLSFLQPDKIRDARRRLKSDSNYDPKTLYVPEDFKNKLTPAVRQWWEIKSQNFDVVLFFKVGKFYELYHMDAVLAAKELNLTFMRGEFAHVGFPEIAYGRFSATLVEKGYKVARVEQTETPDMMNERCKTLSKCTKFDKVVKREICQITSRGTRIFGILDGATKEAESNFLLAVAEKEIDASSSLYGICFVDTSLGLFHVGQFLDDRHASRLRTLVAHYPPVQILFEKNSISTKTQLLFNTVLAGANKDPLVSDAEFWSASNTLIKLAENYFTDNNFPESLNNFIGKSALINMTLSNETEWGVRALGAVIWYLQRCLIDHQLLTMGRFTLYEPIDFKYTADNLRNNENGPLDKHMILDAVTLNNLNVLENSDGTVHGTLLHKLDNCCTSFGKRLLQRWICNPLGNIDSIKCRQDAIRYLVDCDIVSNIRSILSQIPDLERLLLRIHSQGSLGIKESHPDTRAFLFEEKTYSKRKIKDFISTLNGFKTALEVERTFAELDVEKMPRLIRQCLTSSVANPDGCFPNLINHLEFFEKAFDHNEAEKEGRILPSVGTDPKYDEAMNNLNNIERELQQYLKNQCAYFGCKVTYFGSDKKRYQLEVSESASRKATSKYELIGQRKGFKRYMTNETRDFLERKIAAEEKRTDALKNLRERIFGKFSEKFADWNASVQCLAVLDVLLSFAAYGGTENVTSVPQFVAIEPDEQPFVRLINGYYPCSINEDVFIPNNIIIGNESYPPGVLVTGPNMGGKSTLMRQLGLIVIMAHLGCHVPAVELKLSLVDRIFTRLGANDDIMAGESTFYVELCETSSILQHATKQSLILIDELGRGTSTYDGTAIAVAVLNEISRINCRILFSTHYHSLIEDFKTNPSVGLGHMACMVEDSAENEECNSEEVITFLYKFERGACPKSYGFNAARLAGMPTHIIRLAQQRAKQLEVDVLKRSNFKKLFLDQLEVVRELLAAL